ncbi:MAG TPA: ABC transporter substrate-binding protein [Candidatus Acidoferrales bacterium]|nr:ABC transporter substrate-binding protein [Candidatus Acidoferrales bacterium]
MSPPKLVSVRIAYSAPGNGNGPMWIAKEAGFFAEEGLAAEVSLIRGRLPEALMADEVDFGSMAAPAVVAADLKGADLVFVTGGLNWLIQMLVTRPEIEEVAQLRGRTLGQGRSGGIDRFLVPYLLERHGLKVGTDVRTHPVESQPEAIAKMAAGEIDGFLFSPPYAFEAIKRGYRVLIDCGQYRLAYQLDGMVARRSFVERNPDITRAVVRAYARGVHRYKTDPEIVVAVLRKYSLMEDEAVARQTHAAMEPYFPRVPYPTLRGLETILADAAKQHPEAKKFRPEDFADLRWVAELERSGFIRNLYGT